MHTTRGAILPPDMIARIAAGEAAHGDDASYGVPRGTKLREAITAAWNALRPLWANARTELDALPEEDPAAALTRDAFLFPLFQQLGFGRLTRAAFEIDGKPYPVTHRWHHVPVHLPGRVPLDHRGPAGEPIPHNLTQELLNRDDACLWAVVASDAKLRLLRDNLALSRPSYVEFDLAAIFDGEDFAGFARLYRLCHVTRFGDPPATDIDKPTEEAEAPAPPLAPLEAWSKEAQALGTRLLSDLRKGVADAIEHLGRGFLGHPANAPLRDALADGTLLPQDLYRQLLQLVYRLLFLFVAEDRDLLHAPNAGENEKAAFFAHYGTRRLRAMSERFAGNRHDDLWRAHSRITSALATPEGLPALGLPGLGSFLFDPASTPDLTPAEAGAADGPNPAPRLANRDLLAAVRRLAFVQKDQTVRAVDYRNLGSEELGSVYESLLELVPTIDLPARGFALTTAGGNERKTSGSYYTPDSLVQCLLDTALEPVVAERCRGKTHEEQAEAILALRVCDPACGSGHFLISAAHRLARHLARARSGGEEPDERSRGVALRDVIRRCLYGVDINPMAVELCRVALWIESLQPGAPLTFLEHHLRVGNALIGATPELIEAGIPDDAFKPITGDDKEVCKQLKKQNKAERKELEGGEQGHMFRPWVKLGNLTADLQRLATEADDSVAAVQSKADRFSALTAGPAYRNATLLADLWCAAFVWRKTADTDGFGLGPLCPTERMLREVEANPNTVEPAVEREVRRLAGEYQFFHWYLAFPEVFAPAGDGESAGGFDLLLGNPPWEVLEHDVDASDEAPDESLRRESIPRVAKFIRGVSLDHELQGKINLYSVFVNLTERLSRDSGRLALLIPTDFATQQNSSRCWFQYQQAGRLPDLIDFKNEASVFPGLPTHWRFLAFAASPRGLNAVDGAISRVRLGCLDWPSQKTDLSEVTSAFIRSLDPVHFTLPLLDSTRDFSVLEAICINSLPNEATPMASTYRQMVNSTKYKKTLQKERRMMDDLKVSEAKLLEQYDHRAKTFAGVHASRRFIKRAGAKLVPVESKTDARFVPEPRFWLPKPVLQETLPGGWNSQWLLAFRSAVSPKSDSRCTKFTILPLLPILHSSSLFLPRTPAASAGVVGAINVALFNSFTCDFFVRKQISKAGLPKSLADRIPVPLKLLDDDPATDLPGISSDAADPIIARALELSYTAWDLQPFAADCGYDGPPFVWDDERRFEMRAELDAAFFHLYGLSRDDAAYILETFPIVKKKDIKAHGTYRTKDRILALYDAMAAGTFATALDPPPGPPLAADGTYLPFADWTPATHARYTEAGVIHPTDPRFHHPRTADENSSEPPRSADPTGTATRARSQADFEAHFRRGLVFLHLLDKRATPEVVDAGARLLAFPDVCRSLERTGSFPLLQASGQPAAGQVFNLIPRLIAAADSGTLVERPGAESQLLFITSAGIASCETITAEERRHAAAAIGHLFPSDDSTDQKQRLEEVTRRLVPA